MIWYNFKSHIDFSILSKNSPTFPLLPEMPISRNEGYNLCPTHFGIGTATQRIHFEFPWLTQSWENKSSFIYKKMKYIFSKTSSHWYFPGTNILLDSNNSTNSGWDTAELGIICLTHRLFRKHQWFYSEGSKKIQET